MYIYANDNVYLQPLRINLHTSLRVRLEYLLVHKKKKEQNYTVK